METTELEKSQTVSEEQKSNNQLIDEIIQKVLDKKYKIYFYCPPLNIPSGGIFTLLNYAKTLTEAGYDVKVIYEPREDRKASYEASQKARKAISIYEKFNPDWAGDTAFGIKIMPLGNGEIKFTDNTTEQTEVLNLGPEDLLFIPEGFPNIMEQTAQIPCKKVVLCQSWYYILNGLKMYGKTIVGYGASAKSTTFLYQCNVSNKLVDYIIDDNVYKQNYFSPGIHIPIYSIETLKIKLPDYIIILSWNFTTEILKKLETFREVGVRIIVPFPEIKII